MSLFKKFQKLFGGYSLKQLIVGQKISDEEFLLRRVRLHKQHIRPDGSLNSRAFSPRPKDDGKLSVNIESLIESYDKAIEDRSKFTLFKIQASIPHSIDLICSYDPILKTIENEGNIAHCLITGFDEEDESKPAILAMAATRLPFPMG